MFQVIGVFVLVAGAVAGAYAGFGRHGTAHHGPALGRRHAVIPPDTVAEEKPAARTLAKAKAEAAAAAEAERARKANEIAAREQARDRRPQPVPARTEAPPVPSSCNEFSGNRALGCALLLEAGFGLDQMGCLDAMWTKESDWNEQGQNNSSGAYGIPQALPASKMAAYGEDYLTNPVPQIRWGLNYIKSRYSTPVWCLELLAGPQLVLIGPASGRAWSRGPIMIPGAQTLFCTLTRLMGAELIPASHAG